jgi:hypothetical protein
MIPRPSPYVPDAALLPARLGDGTALPCPAHGMRSCADARRERVMRGALAAAYLRRCEDLEGRRPEVDCDR